VHICCAAMAALHSAEWQRETGITREMGWEDVCCVFVYDGQVASLAGRECNILCQFEVGRCGT
jgi:hypothetical protein